MKKFIIETEDNINDSFLMKIFDVYLPSEYMVEEIKFIDEEKLDELAINFVTKGRNIPFINQIAERVAFKAGYRKAKEE